MEGDFEVVGDNCIKEKTVELENNIGEEDKIQEFSENCLVEELERVDNMKEESKDSGHKEDLMSGSMKEHVKRQSDMVTKEEEECIYENSFEEKMQEKLFKCSYCGYVTKHKSYLKVHIRKHTGERSYACSVCGKSFATSKDRNRHEIIHSKEKPFQCSVCEKKFAQKPHLVNHMRFHSGDNVFDCRICGKVFGQNWHLESHMLTHSEKTFSCSKCSKTFARENDCQKHELTHEKKALTCDVCKRIFFNKYSFKRHVLGHENNVSPTCHICRKTFTTKSELNRHLQIHKAEEPPKSDEWSQKTISCSMCGEKFAENSEFRRHMRIHATNKSENPFKCNICSKSFKLSTNLKRHMVNHVNENAYKCPDCPGKRFVSSRQLWRHKRAHNGKCHCCDLCGKKYSSSFSLKEHLKNHSDNPIQCVKCSYIFATKDALTKHMKRCKSVLRTYNYKCPFCFTAYAVKPSVIRHVRMHHAFEEEKDDMKASSCETQHTLQCPHCEKCFSSERSLEWHKVCIHLMVTPMNPVEAVSATRRTFRREDTVENDRNSVIYVEVNSANDDKISSLTLMNREDMSEDYDKKNSLTSIKTELKEVEGVLANDTTNDIAQDIEKDESSDSDNYSDDEDPLLQVENDHKNQLAPKVEKYHTYVIEGFDYE